MSKLDHFDVLSIQNTVLALAVESLIATHPDRAKVRARFDQMYAQFQVGPAMIGNQEAQDFARSLIDKMFEA